MITEEIESVKDAVAKLEIPADKKQVLQAMLSGIRSQLLLLDRRAMEASMRQDVYADVCEKMFDKVLQRNY